jgi:membrane protein DedA with SNARE-associated domain
VIGFLALAAATFVSEDLACLSAGLLVYRGEVSASLAVAACVVGIVVGDAGLWAIGRGARSLASRWPDTHRWLDLERFRHLSLPLARHAGGAIVASRFLPGSRLPLYLLAGALRVPLRVFATWAFVAALLWVPAVVLLTATLGTRVADPLAGAIEHQWVVQVGLVTAGFALLSAARAASRRWLRPGLR